MEQIKGEVANLPREQAVEDFATRMREYDARQGTVKGEGLLMSIGRGMVRPFAKSFRNIAAAAVELPAQFQRERFMETEEERIGGFEESSRLAKEAQQATDPAERERLLAESRAAAEGVPERREFGRGAVGTKVPVLGELLSQREAEQISEKPGKALFEQGLKPAAGVLAYAVPFGGAARFGGTLPQLGATAARQALLPGAIAGGLTSLATTPETANWYETISRIGGGAALGAATAALTTKAGEVIGKKAKARRIKRLERKQLLDDIDAAVEGDKFLYPSDFGAPTYQDENIVKRTGNKVLAEQHKISSAQARRWRLMETQRKMSDYGFSNADDWPIAAKRVTGKSGVLTKIKNGAISNADDVETSGFLQFADDNLLEEGSILTPARKKAVGQTLRDEFVNMSGGAKGSLNPRANPTAVGKTISKFDGWSAELAPRNNLFRNPRHDAEARVWKRASYFLKERLYNPSTYDDAGNVLIQRGNANAQSVQMTQQYLKQLNAISPALAKDAASVTTLGHSRHLASHFVNASKIHQAGVESTGRGFASVLTNGQSTTLSKLLGKWVTSLPVLGALTESRMLTAGLGTGIRSFGGSPAGVGAITLPGRAATAGLGLTQRAGEATVRSLPKAGAIAVPLAVQRQQALQRAAQ